MNEQWEVYTLFPGHREPLNVRKPTAVADRPPQELERRRSDMARLNIKPLGDKVIVKRLEAEAKTAGGIVLPDTAKEKPKRGIVLAIGNGKLLDDGTRGEMQVKKDDEVLFTSYAGTEIKVNGEDYMIMDESDILGVVG